MPDKYGACCKCSRRTIFSVSENRKSFRIKNPGKKTICQVSVDRCLLPKISSRCDYLFNLSEADKEILHFVELKGRHVSDAVKQLESSILKCSKYHTGDVEISAWVISSSSPSSTPKNQQLQLKFKRKTGATLKFATNSKEITL